MDAAEHANPATSLPHRVKLQILWAVLLGLFLSALDQTVVGTALPRIVTDLGGNELYTWVVTVYLLTSTITVPFYGKLSDLFGRRPVLLFGISLFLLGSALSGLSQTMWQLILFRGIQGIGAGAMFPIALAVIADLFSPAERSKYQGLFGAVFGLSSLVGPAIGGLLTDHFGWHWVFYVNLPIGFVSLYGIWRLLPAIRPGTKPELDYLGAAIFTVAMGFLLVGLTNAQNYSWISSQVGGFVVLGLALAAVFLFVESRAAHPIVPLDLWRNPGYATSVAAALLVSVGFFACVVFLPRWFQVVRGDSATASGYLMFPLLIGLIGSSTLSGRFVSKTGQYKPLLVAAVALLAVGLLLLTRISADSSTLEVALSMVVAGLGIGPTLPILTIAVQSSVPLNQLGVATSNLTFFRQVGGSVGLSIAGTVFGSRLASEVPRQLAPILDKAAAAAPAGAGDGLRQGLLASAASLDPNHLTGVGQSFGQALAAAAPAQLGPTLTPLVPQIDQAFFTAFSLSIATIFGLAAIPAACAALLALSVKPVALRGRGHQGSGAPGQGARSGGAPAGGYAGGAPRPAPPPPAMD
ncbi:MAG: MDR family MFS transporter [Bauldia sp.]